EKLARKRLECVNPDGAGPARSHCRYILALPSTDPGAERCIQGFPQGRRCSAIATAAVLKCAAPHRNRPLPNIHNSPSPSGRQPVPVADEAPLLTPFSPSLEPLPFDRTPRSKCLIVFALNVPMPPRSRDRRGRPPLMRATRAAANRNHLHDTPRELAGRRRRLVDFAFPLTRYRFSRVQSVSLQGSQRFSVLHRSRLGKHRSVFGRMIPPGDANRWPAG